MAELIVHRASKLGILRSYAVLIDGQRRGRIRWRATERFVVPDGPVTVQARIDWAGSPVWHGHAGSEPTQVTISTGDPVLGTVFQDRMLVLHQDGHPLTAEQQHLVEQGNSAVRWFGVLLLASVLFFVALFISLTTHHPALVGLAALLYAVAVGVGLGVFIRSRLAASRDRPSVQA
ncbi:hypothetical protein [Allobranchiibius huperziae]|uniref:Uncharacterized protein n=1 Tax=Allobranchiibius huperziae TaxID=1874116 RepID=A0A853DIX5_9MICO|nr:hypothetical protein [Allobranchiibius huperziae]NYJ74670.1 hypothetical protein [Allobranchiibius huperziae]